MTMQRTERAIHRWIQRHKHREGVFDNDNTSMVIYISLILQSSRSGFVEAEVKKECSEGI